MAKDTRNRILEASLELFAKNGYAATNIKDISDAVGIVKSAFYRHFASKEEAFDAVMEMMASYYEENMGSTSRMPPVPDSMEELKQLTMKMVNFTVHDERIIQSRKRCSPFKRRKKTDSLSAERRLERVYHSGFSGRN